MCDIPSIAVFCSESIECFPGTASKFFLKLLVTIPVSLIITGIIVHFRFHVHCISIPNINDHNYSNNNCSYNLYYYYHHFIAFLCCVVSVIGPIGRRIVTLMEQELNRIIELKIFEP